MNIYVFLWPANISVVVELSQRLFAFHSRATGETYPNRGQWCVSH